MCKPIHAATYKLYSGGQVDSDGSTVYFGKIGIYVDIAKLLETMLAADLWYNTSCLWSHSSCSPSVVQRCQYTSTKGLFGLSNTFWSPRPHTFTKSQLASNNFCKSSVKTDNSTTTATSNSNWPGVWRWQSRQDLNFFLEFSILHSSPNYFTLSYLTMPFFRREEKIGLDQSCGFSVCVPHLHFPALFRERLPTDSYHLIKLSVRSGQM